MQRDDAFGETLRAISRHSWLVVLVVSTALQGSEVEVGINIVSSGLPWAFSLSNSSVLTGPLVALYLPVTGMAGC